MVEWDHVSMFSSSQWIVTGSNVSLLGNAFNCYSENFQGVLSSSLAVGTVWEVVAPSAWPLGRPEFS